LFIHQAGSPNQSLSRLPLGTQVDDFGWIRSAADRTFVVDGPANAIWQITGQFTPGTLYAEAPNDSGVASFIGAIDPSTGTVTPVAVGFKSPTGLAIVPGTE